MRVVETITGTAGCYALAGVVCRAEAGRFVAKATAYRLNPSRGSRILRSVATASFAEADLEASGATALEARAGLCIVCREQLAATRTTLEHRPVVFLVPALRRPEPVG